MRYRFMRFPQGKTKALTFSYDDGEEITDSQAAEIERQVNAKFGDKVEITFINGGQPVYYFIISVE